MHRISLRVVLLLGSCLLLLPVAAVEAQQGGRIVGRVVDTQSGNPISGAQVEVIGTAVNTTTALDGRYVVTGVPAGPTSIRVRMIGYAPKVVTGVQVPASGTVLQDIAVAATAVQLAEIAVTAEAERGTVNRALDEQRNAVNIVNSVSAEQISKSPDSDAGQAVQRVSGVTVQDGKYVFVRGLGERYTTTTLNGSRIPSPEPERKVVPLDLFPSQLLEGITTSKTFTPEQPGDFSGAEVNLKTREFPAERMITFTASGGWNSAATAKSIVRPPLVGEEWLGFAGSERQLPEPVRDAGDLRGISQTDANSLIASFRNAWSAHSADGSPTGGASMSIGGEGPFLGQPIGYAGSFSYSYDQVVRKDETKGLAKNGPTFGTAVPYNSYQGSSGVNSVLWGGLLNLSTRIGEGSKLSFNNTYTRGGDNDASVLAGDNEEFSQFNPLTFTRLEFIERAVRSNQLAGEHLLGEKHFITWSVTSSGVIRNSPDRSDIGYQSRPDASGAVAPVSWVGQPRFATRTFSELDEHSWDFSGNYRLTLGSSSYPIQLKVGGDYRTTNRDADTRAYDLINLGLSETERSVQPEQIFTDQNAIAGEFLLNANANGGRYTADEKIGAGYVQAEVPLTSRLQLIGGARVENWRVNVNTVTTTGEVVPADPRNTDILPAIALTYRLTGNQNLRASATQTLSRPEYRELSPVPYFEQVGLATTIGNPDLQRALIQNYDLRWEWFPAAGEVLSIGMFAKTFDNPIEKVIIQSAGTNTLSFVNADNAHNYGVELELRKGLAALGLRDFNFFTNTTLMKSRITPGNEGISSLTNKDRPMVGQSEYVVNAGLGYSSRAGGWFGTLLYNVAGKRIVEAGSGGLPDAYEQPRHIVDASLQLPVVASVSLKLDAKNLLDAPYRMTQGDVVRWRYTSGRLFQFAFTWHL